MDRQQLDGGDAEALEVLDERGVGEAGVGAPQVLGDVGVPHRRALHVDLVDDRVRPRRAQLAVAVPVEERVDDDAAGDERAPSRCRWAVGVGPRWPKTASSQSTSPSIALA